ncbi:MAG: DUF1611 domain-containing protein, partial [Oleibacter sp.]|nr:DUF1611 domain-containing protein [Thalassolituus sp.]
MQIQPPYLLFLGDASDPLTVKTSRGVAEWRPEKCIGEHKLPDCALSLGLPAMSIQEAAEKGAKTFIIGLANRGGSISENWLPSILEALSSGLDIASGLHQKLADVPAIREAADKHGRQLFDVRHCTQRFDVGTGKKRSGKRLLA